MRRIIPLAAILLAGLTITPAIAAPRVAVPAAAEKTIYKIDGVIATFRRSAIVIQAKGAVAGGGWKGAKLRAVKSPGDPHTIVVEFVAVPPPPSEAVIPGLLPVTASTIVRSRPGVVTVRVAGEVNDVTTQILK